MHRLFLFILLFSASAAFGQQFSKSENVASVKSKIDNKAKETKSISADFEEVMYSSMFNTPKKAKGKLLYKDPSKIRWEHTSPNKKIILINGAKARFQENGKEVTNPTANKVVKKIQGLMVQLFNGDFLNEKEFNVSYYESASQYKLILKPKSSRMSRYISSIELLFSKKTALLDEMAMIETADDKLVYSFSNTQTNGSISDSKFTQF
ncbi:MAG: outer membrane lipoprotein carrier protein LolA [Crocinitomicaceae bacterium]